MQEPKNNPAPKIQGDAILRVWPPIPNVAQRAETPINVKGEEAVRVKVVKKI